MKTKARQRLGLELLEAREVPAAVGVTALANPAEGGTVGQLAFTRDGDTADPLTVNFSLGGTASGGDYAADAGSSGSLRTVTFAAGQATARVNVAAVNDVFYDPNETVTAALAAGAGYDVGGAPATLTVQDNDASVPTVSITPSVVTAREGTRTAFTFRRTGGLEGSLSAPVRLSTGVSDLPAGLNQMSEGRSEMKIYGPGGSAVTYFNISGFGLAKFFNTQFASGSATATYAFEAVADGLAEPDEYAALYVQPGSGYTAGPDKTLLKIADATQVVSFATSGFTLSSGQSATITVKRAGPTDAALPVRFAVPFKAKYYDLSYENGPAIPKSLFVNVTIPAGASEVRLTFTARTIPPGTPPMTWGLKLLTKTDTSTFSNFYAIDKSADTINVTLLP